MVVKTTRLIEQANRAIVSIVETLAMYSTFVERMLRKYIPISTYVIEITIRDSNRNYIMDTLKFRLVMIMVRGYLTFGVSFNSFSDNDDIMGI